MTQEIGRVLVFLGQDPGDVFIGVAGVDDQRQARARRPL